jgi:hypothetical protein
MAITRSQQAKQMLQDGGMLVQPGFGGTRQGYRGDDAYGGGGDKGGDKGGDNGRSDRMGSLGKTGPSKGLSDKARGNLEAMTKGLRSSISAQNRAAAAKDFFNKIKNISPTYNLVKGITNLFGPKGPIDPYSGGKTGLHSGFGTTDDDDDENRGGNENMLPMLYNPIIAASSMMNPMTPKEGIGSLDLNRIAYRFMADGGFLEDTDEARQAYGLGSIVRKITRPIKKVVSKATKAVKKVTKSPLGRLALAVAAPYALGPAMAQSQFLMGLSAAQKAALISGATTGITQVASGEDLDLKDIALSAAIGGTSAKFFPPGGAKPGAQQSFSRPTMADVAGPSLPQTPSGFTRPTMADIAGPTRTSTFIRPTMADVGVKGMPSVKQSGLEKLIASSRRGLGKVKDSKLTDILLRNDKGKLSPLKIASLAGLAGLATAKGVGQEEEFEEMDRGPGIDIDAIRRRPFDYMAPRFAGSQFDFYAAEGGQAKKEPVAKKVMPLLDMGGMEKDYREEGGFVPIGRMEKADDVPARLSKNEFVFTADAVRNAGDGDVDKGAEVMYNMMKNLEAGGDVSEESQGLEGARRMFQTSQRLEEVL